MYFHYQDALSVYRILVVTFLALVLCSCGGSVSWSPPIIPVEVSVDTEGNITAAIKGQLLTPLGTFEVGPYITLLEFLKQEHPELKGSLTVRLNGWDTVYPLDQGDFDIQFASGYYEKIGLSKNDSNILLELRRIESYEDASRLMIHVGGHARVKYVYEANLRRSPGFATKEDYDVITRVPAGAIVQIIGGPEYADGISWWEVSWQDYIGWLAETRGSGNPILEAED